MAQYSNPGIWEVEVGGPEVQGHSPLHRDSYCLVWMIRDPILKKKKPKTKTHK